ncbi:hypothetical protein ATN84_10860 [Paramesorhizobium deserti]|uniref:Probable alginate O-acetylase AlgI n=1 Tax=Paramesorhizobium deserti TaxID=1494590 RepID=A0A135HTM0_9HYPH|nr:MBOAT family O-acyltransferase [Paramesorhizobium deserti]KXF76555.1 hypothetical protein ATN84_10860 [Paramesorhizobium deserti]
MVFSDQGFIFFFLPITLAVCLTLRGTRAFNPAILVASLIFFYWESGVLTLILLFSIVLNYIGGLIICRSRKKAVLVVFLLANFAILAYFKYTGFLLGNFDFFGNSSIRDFAGGIILPIGISFYTFQGVSYLIDVWRSDVEPEPNLVLYAAYQSFFPQIIAGPIVRYGDVYKCFRHPDVSADHFAGGAARFLHGLAKKVLIADTVSVVANAAFFSGGDMTFASAWLGALAFTVQIYFDFSGYSDMAIGLALMFGVRFNENFNHPYAASTITEFWRRWHISLSTWFREYLYIPLGGNRVNHTRIYFNLFIVFLATGIWHGAAWPFLLWGLYHGGFLIVERVLGIGGSTNPVLRFVYFLPATIVGWALFQAPDLATFGRFIAGMFAPFSPGAFNLSDEMLLAFTPQAALAFGIGIIAILAQGKVPPLGPILHKPGSITQKAGRLAFIAVTAAVTSIFVFPQGFSPFLYFRF